MVLKVLAGQYRPKCFRYVFASIMEQTPALTVPKPLGRVFLCFFGWKASLCHSLYTRFIIAFHPDEDVRRTLCTRTPNAVHTYTECCTHVHRTTYARTPNDVRRRFRLTAVTKRCSGCRRKRVLHIIETFGTTFLAGINNIKKSFHFMTISLLFLNFASYNLNSNEENNI